MRTSNPFSSGKLTESQRLHRIAEILCDAIIRSSVGSVIQAPPTGEVSEPPIAAMPELREAEAGDEGRILRYLALVGEASPVGIRGALGFSRSKTWRVLQRLAQDGRIIGTGQTRQLVYQINARAPTADKIGLN